MTFRSCLYERALTRLSNSDEDIKEAFNCFDINNNGYISAQELRFIFNSLQEDVQDDEIDEMIRLADTEGDGQVNWISFYEFIKGAVNPILY